LDEDECFRLGARARLVVAREHQEDDESEQHRESRGQDAEHAGRTISVCEVAALRRPPAHEEHRRDRDCCHGSDDEGSDGDVHAGGRYSAARADDSRAARLVRGGTVAATDGHSAISIAPLERDDLPAADRVFRLAFGTQYGLSDPLAFAPGSEMVRSRLHAPHVRSFKASRNGGLVGSAFVSRWGSLAVFGPLTVDPGAWGLGIGSQLLDACLDVGAEWDVTRIGLFTLPDSPKHLRLYRKHGFWPGSL